MYVEANETSTIRLTQDKVEFLFEFCNFAALGFLYIAWPSILSLMVPKPIHKQKLQNKISIEETVLENSRKLIS